MARALAIAVLALLAGCAHTQAQVTVGAAPPAAGGFSGAVRVQAGSGAAALAALGLLAGAAWFESSQAGVRYRANPFLAIEPDAPRRAPPMDDARRVNAQDCTRPIEDASANLRCR
ncbi:MAG: hypothetical protein N2653_13180 [Burkholderiales bacterium]|nr:hypothetical protein [Burkholderiales bacterium]